MRLSINYFCIIHFVTACTPTAKIMGGEIIMTTMEAFASPAPITNRPTDGNQSVPMPIISPTTNSLTTTTGGESSSTSTGISTMAISGSTTTMATTTTTTSSTTKTTIAKLATTMAMPQTEMPTTTMTSTEMPTTEMPTTTMTSTEMPTKEMPTTTMTSTEMPTKEMPTTTMTSTEMPTTTTKGMGQQCQPFPLLPVRREDINSRAIAQIAGTAANNAFSLSLRCIGRSPNSALILTYFGPNGADIDSVFGTGQISAVLSCTTAGQWAVGNVTNIVELECISG